MTTVEPNKQQETNEALRKAVDKLNAEKKDQAFKNFAITSIKFPKILR